MSGYDLWLRRAPMLAHCDACGHSRLDHEGGWRCKPLTGECECVEFAERALEPDAYRAEHQELPRSTESPRD